MPNSSPIDFNEIEGETEVVSPEVYAANLVEWAMERKVSDIFISDDEHSVTVMVRRLGQVEIVRRLASGYGNRLQGHFRVIAGAGAGDFIRPAEGRGLITTPSGQYVDFRLSSIPTLFGQDVTLRLFDPARGKQNISELGMDEETAATLNRLLDQRSGLILVSGPVASGKTSTLYSAINHLNNGTRKIHTLEDPIEQAIAGVQQSQVNLRAGVDFAELLAAVLRHSPDVIMIGEVRDARTAATAVRAGASGQLVLATVHADSAVEAINVMLQYETNLTFLARTLIGVINQRLVRKLCTLCRQEVPCDTFVPENAGVQIRLADNRPQIYRAVGCESCFHHGYDAMVCIAELMVVDRDIERSIIENVSPQELEQMAISAGMLNLPAAAQLRVLQGDTTTAEAIRVIEDPELNQFAASVRAAH